MAIVNVVTSWFASSWDCVLFILGLAGGTQHHPFRHSVKISRVVFSLPRRLSFSQVFYNKEGCEARGWVSGSNSENRGEWPCHQNTEPGHRKHVYAMIWKTQHLIKHICALYPLPAVLPEMKMLKSPLVWQGHPSMQKRSWTPICRVGPQSGSQPIIKRWKGRMRSGAGWAQLADTRAVTNNKNAIWFVGWANPSGKSRKESSWKWHSTSAFPSQVCPWNQTLKNSSPSRRCWHSASLKSLFLGSFENDFSFWGITLAMEGDGNGTVPASRFQKTDYPARCWFLDFLS